MFAVCLFLEPFLFINYPRLWELWIVMKKSYLPAGMLKSQKLITTNLKDEGWKVEAPRSEGERIFVPYFQLFN